MQKQNCAVLCNVDVVIVGGGFAGVCAAVAAARAGANTVLIERDGMLGGQAAEVYTFGLDAVIDRNGHQLIRGIPWEIIQRTVAEGQSDPMWTKMDFRQMEREGVDATMRKFGLTASFMSHQYLNPEAFRYVLQTLIDNEGITTLLESPLIGTVLEGNRVIGVMVQGNYSPFAVMGQVVVDATAHAAVASFAGRLFPCPEVYVGTHPRVAGVQIHRLLEYLRDHLDDVEFVDIELSDHDSLIQLVQRGSPLLMKGFSAVLQKAIIDNSTYKTLGRGNPPFLKFFYDRDGCGTYWVHSDKWSRTKLDDPVHLSKTIAEMRKQQWLTHRLFRTYVPGFKRAHLMDTQPHIARAFHISRGSGGFTECDIPWEYIKRGGKVFEDSIARIMGHPSMGQAADGFQLPYMSLLPKKLEGLLVTGKAACRFVHYHGTCGAVGQAAGVAAALATREGVSLRKLPVSLVQQELHRQGAVVF